MTRAVLVAVLALALALGPGGATHRASAAPKVRGEITVLAAASLTEAFTTLARRFERRHRDAEVVLGLGASSTLVTQVQQGVPADVVATADEPTMERLLDSGDVRTSRIFARNRLAIAVAPGNPREIRTLADTLDPEVTLVLCAPEVPCGSYAREAYRRADLRRPDVPTGADVKGVLAKVSLGEADAAVVYATDITAADGAVEAVEIPDEQNVVARYPMARVVDAENRAGGKAFVTFVRSRAGRRVLCELGFLRP